ncbi:paired amphipathic helix protein Sin3-like 5 [Punica granatum]|uniref:Paired amphipathic helix protein Sin3-like 5 n=1 Tax=Punica granatum TaxID=22663 RepID=A0A6P8E0A3_PUNGR|nr:paired amphipathic helix protein Sin3-like 5 [Punica granatum]
MVKVKPSRSDAIDFYNKVRDAFGDESLELHLFIEAFRKYRSSLDSAVFLDKVTTLLGARPDLLRSLNFLFLPDERKIKIRGINDPRRNKAVSKLMFECTIDFVTRARKQLRHHPGVYESFVKIVSTNKGDLVEAYSKVSILLKDFPDLLCDCSRYFPKSVIKRAKEPETSLSCARFGPSYMLLPEAKVKSRPGSGLAAQVLNHHVVLKRNFPMSDSSENQRERCTHVNQHDDELFYSEDYRYELDMLIETIRSAIARIKNFLEQSDRSAGPIKGIRDHLIAADLRCIEQIYGEHGLEMVDGVHKEPRKALPVVLGRFEQKEAEWVKFRSEMNERWKQVHQSQ